MKQKDLVYLLMAVVIFLVAGYVGYTQLVPKKSSSSNTVTVDVIGSIPAEMNSDGLTQLGDPTKVRDFSTPVDLSGLGNQAPFGP